MKNLAIIPARSGSKGLKDKNIRLLNGKPIIAYSIEAALRSNMFDTVMVSTDSEKYAEIAKTYGAEIPFLRSEKTSGDKASSWDMVEEVINNYAAIERKFDTLMLLQPTSPLRTAEDITNAYELYSRKNANSIVSVCPVDHSPLLCGTLPDDHSLIDFIPKTIKGKRRQDMKEFYRFNGAIYLSNVDFFLKTKDIFSSKCYAYIMDKKRSVDIDDSFDFVIAEAMMSI